MFSGFSTDSLQNQASPNNLFGYPRDKTENFDKSETYVINCNDFEEKC